MSRAQQEAGIVKPGALLWSPPPDARETTRMGRFLDWVEETRTIDLPDYQAAWEWSVTDLEGFWGAIAEFFDLIFHSPPERVLAERRMPGARWLPGATLNYAEHALRYREDRPAVVARSDTRPDLTLSFVALAGLVARAAAGLRRLGVERGDRVAAYLPNIPETLVAFLATASLGAVWSSCAPEFGTRSVTDRFRQIEPKVLLAIDGYRYGPKEVDRSAEVAAIRAELPTVEATVGLPYLGSQGLPETVGWDDFLSEDAPSAFEPVPFDHPLFILYSSGTTGLPKPIVHGHGGILLEHHKKLALHHDLGPGDRFFWFTTTGWMMWNYLASSLLLGATAVTFDGDPGHPDPATLWRMAEELGVTYLGVSAGFIMGCRRAGLRPGRDFDLSGVRGVGSTGSPLPAEGFAWVYQQVGGQLQLGSMSGGTDVCTAFVGASPLLPVHAGEILCRCLGAKVEAYDEEGRPVIGQRGELVITEPMPSMPVGFWGDQDGSRYRAAYFEHFPGVWRHGDWLEITPRGSCIITGRSDATLNRGGVRMGTAEFYRVVEGIEGVAESLVVHLEDDDRLFLFVVPAEGAELDEALRDRIVAELRRQLSPRHVPDHIHGILAVPFTINGKKMELPVKRILSGEPIERVANPGAMANPASLDTFVAIASEHAGARTRDT
ncbi:MAG: acetoacetate--CoA ligase [Acidimicrobiia bacterium]